MEDTASAVADAEAAGASAVAAARRDGAAAQREARRGRQRQKQGSGAGRCVGTMRRRAESEGTARPQDGPTDEADMGNGKSENEKGCPDDEKWVCLYEVASNVSVQSPLSNRCATDLSTPPPQRVETPFTVDAPIGSGRVQRNHRKALERRVIEQILTKGNGVCLSTVSKMSSRRSRRASKGGLLRNTERA